MKVLMDIPKEINDMLMIYRIQNNIRNKQEAIIYILKEKFVDEEMEDG